MKASLQSINALDIVVLLKLCIYSSNNWNQKVLAEELFISQSEVSRSVARLKYARLLYPNGKKVMRLALMEILQYAVAYFFPQQPGAIIRGIPTAHSASPLNAIIVSNEHFVWPSGTGNLRGQAITPLYPNAIKAVKNDSMLYEYLALTDALRVGRAREKNFAIEELKYRILGEKQNH